MGETVVEYKGVEVCRQEHVVLKDVTFSIDAGEMVYLIGKVGSGKSSLIKTMYAEVPVSGGDATVLGHYLPELRRKHVPQLRRSLGVVFQDFQLLYDRNVRDNLMFVLRATGWRSKAEANERIDRVLAEAGLQGKDYKMPFELSGGEQQRVVIARALLNRPKLLIADEPTGNLDPATSETIVERLRAIAAEGTAVIMVTHNLNLVERYPARVLEIVNKRIIDRPFNAPAKQEPEQTPAPETRESAPKADESATKARESAPKADDTLPTIVPTIFS